MLTANITLAFIKFRNDDIFDIQSIDADSNSYDIDDGVDGTNFVKMNLIYRFVVCLCFSFSNDLEDFQCDQFGTTADTAAVDDGLNTFKIAVFMMMVMMFMFMVMFMSAVKLFHVMVMIFVSLI